MFCREAVLGRIAALDVSVVNPLLMSFFEDYAEGEGAFTRGDLLSMLRTAESYLFRGPYVTSPRTV